jgi:hypothetical protein
MLRPSEWLRSIGALAFLFFCCSPLAFAQVQTGEILGVVTDSTGAAVPSASVTITDLDTGISRAVKTDDQGRYDAADLQIGNYQVQTEMQGFAPQVQKGIVLAIGQKVVTDFKLQIGAVTQEVTVSSSVAPQVNTTSSEVGGLVNQDQLQELPLNGRSYEQLFALVPGVQPLQAAQTGANFGSAPRFSVAGARTTAGSVLLDGVQIRSFWGGGGGLQIIGTSLGVEGIAEFQTLTSNFNAQYSGISVVNQVTRSGSNNLHGSVYGFFRNSAMDARGFFDPLSGPPAFHRNQFGGAIGGPIKKNKTFFFVNYEGLRAELGLQNTENIPDHNMQLGWLPCSQLSKITFAAQCTGTPTPPGSTLVNVGAMFPAAYATMQPFLALYPDVTSGPVGPITAPAGYTNLGNGTLQTVIHGQQPQSENYISAKIDHELTSKNRFAIRYVMDQGNETNPWQNGGNPGPPGFNPILGSFEHDPERNQYITLQDTHVFSESVINVATASFVRTNQESGDDLSKQPAPMIFLPSTGKMGTLTVSGALAQIGTSSYLPLQWLMNNFTEQDEVDWVKGAHSFKFGASVLRIDCNCNQITGPGGTYTFAAFGGTTGPASSLESFMEARPSTLQGPLPGFQSSQRYSRQTNISGYVQDDWKATRKLTFNLGLRYDYITNPTEATGVLFRITNIDPSTCSNNAACGTPHAGISGSPSDPGCPTAATAGCGWTHESHYFASNPSTKNIDPRIGLAWDVFGDHKTSIRAGWGIFHGLLYPREYVPGGSFGYPQAQGFANAPTFPHPTNFGATAVIGRNQAPWNYKNTPYTQEYSATIERQLPLGLAMSLGYVGSTSIHMVENVESNTIIPLAGTNNLFRPLNPATTAGAACAPACTNGFGTNGAGYIPNTTFTYVTQISPVGNANYNGMLLSVKRNVGKGVQVQSSYTYSRCLDYASGTPSSIDAPNDSQAWTNPYLPKKFNYGPCAYNTSQNWTTNALLPLPFHGNQFKEGWQIAFISSVRSGSVVTPTLSAGFDRSNLVNYNYAAQRPDVAVGGPALYTKTVTYGASPVVQWFNPAHYALPALGWLGNAPRASIVGPGFFGADVSIMKRTRIAKLGESAGLEIRADAFNIFNRTNFSLPSGAIFAGTTGANANAGRISNITGTARQLQFSARFVF